MTISLAALAALSTLAQAPTEKATLKGHTHFVHYVAFAGDALYSASWDRTVRRWDLAKGEPTTLDVQIALTAPASLSADGSVLAAGFGKGAKAWNLKAGKEAASFELPGDDHARVTLSPDGKTLAMCERGSKPSVLLKDVATGKEMAKLSGHPGTIYGVAFSADGKSLVSAGDDGVVKVWDVKKGELVATFKTQEGRGFWTATFSPDGKLVAAGGWSTDNTIRVWDVGAKKEVAKLAGHTGGVRGGAFSPDAKLLATASYPLFERPDEKTLKLWDVKTWTEVATLGGHQGVWSVAFSADGKLLASGGGADKSIKLWDVSKVGGR